MPEEVPAFGAGSPSTSIAVELQGPASIQSQALGTTQADIPSGASVSQIFLPSSNADTPVAPPLEPQGSPAAEGSLLVIGAPVDPLLVAETTTLEKEKVENTWIEYEDVLTDWEKKLIDRVDACARKVCPFKSCEKRAAEARRNSRQQPAQALGKVAVEEEPCEDLERQREQGGVSSL